MGDLELSDAEFAAFRQRFECREVLGVTVLVLDEPLADDDHRLLRSGVRRIVLESGRRGFVCDLRQIDSMDNDLILRQIVECQIAIAGGGGQYACLPGRMFLARYRYAMTRWWLRATFGSPWQSVLFDDEAEAVVHLRGRLQETRP